MSCCSSCQTNGTSCQGQGMGWLGLGNVSIVGGRVVPGSVIEWKGQILWQDVDERISWHSDAEGRIKNILWAHGGFARVDAGAMPGYISIVVRTNVEFAYLADVYSTIEGAVWQAGYRPQMSEFRVVSVPAGTPQSPQITQPGKAGGGVQQPDSSWSFPSISLPNLPDIFGGSNRQSNDGNPIDSLASWLGVGQTQAALIGAGIGIGAIFLLKRLL